MLLAQLVHRDLLAQLVHKVQPDQQDRRDHKVQLVTMGLTVVMVQRDLKVPPDHKELLVLQVVTVQRQLLL